MRRGKPLSTLSNEEIAKTTKSTLLYHCLLQEPFLSLHTVLGLILTKYLGATAVEIAILTTLRPVVSLLSFYWGSFINEKPSSLKKNLMSAHALGLFPFLFVPLFPNISYLIFCSGVFTLFYRAEAPALMEILRRNLGKKEREGSFSFATTAAYIEGIVFALFSGWMIERLDSSWVYLFSIYSTVSLASLYFQYRLPINEIETKVEKKPLLKESLELLKKRPDFFWFQVGYFFCGGGLMLSQPALPGFLTSSALGFALLLTSMGAMKQLGMMVATPVWGLLMKKVRYEVLSIGVFVMVALFLLMLALFPLSAYGLFLAYSVYGIAQAGSHMLWNLSGPYFSQNEESSRYTMVNVFMVGLRGVLLPPIGGIIADVMSPQTAILIGATFCFIGAVAIYSKLVNVDKKKSIIEV